MGSQLDPVDRQGVKIDPAEIHLCCELNVANVARVCDTMRCEISDALMKIIPVPVPGDPTPPPSGSSCRS
jgi:hypothetical protein